MDYAWNAVRSPAFNLMFMLSIFVNLKLIISTYPIVSMDLSLSVQTDAIFTVAEKSFNLVQGNDAPRLCGQ